MKIIICGSMQFEPKMAEVAEELRSRGYEVDKPNSVEGHAYGEAEDLDKHAGLKRGFIDEHFAKIDTAEAILVVNEKKRGIDGYIGGNTLIEIGYAYSQGLDIILLNPVPEMSYTDEINGIHPIVINGDLDEIDRHIAGLPLVQMSTASALKHRAIARAMRKAGIPVRVSGVAVESGVAEQPLSIEDTYRGAMNRHKALIDLGTKADYYATVESGQHKLHPDHNLFGGNAVIIQPANGSMQIGLDVDIEYPKEMLDKVPSQYPDFGVLVQEEYGATEKDPYPYITGHRLTRQETIERAAYYVAIRLPRQEVA